MLRRLLKRISHRNQLRLAPRRANERNANRQAADKPCGPGDVRIARDPCRRRKSAAAVVATDEIREPGRAAARCDERVEFVVQQSLVNALFARELQVVGELIAESKCARLQVHRQKLHRQPPPTQTFGHGTCRVRTCKRINHNVTFISQKFDEELGQRVGETRRVDLNSRLLAPNGIRIVSRVISGNHHLVCHLIFQHI